MEDFFTTLKSFADRFTRGQQIALASVLVGSVVMLSIIAFWVGQPEYELLRSKVTPEEANQIVQTLEADDIPYELRNGETAIYVPAENVDRLKIRFASEVPPSDGSIGYEIFDNTGFGGMTDFMQRINGQRALEGELARTISTFQQVERARVKLAIPERSPFRGSQEKHSAAIALTLKAALDAQQIEGITALVASSVVGLEKGDVTVFDQGGNLLSDPNAGNEELLQSNVHLRAQKEFEDHLIDKGQTVLDRFLGEGNSVVTINADLNFISTHTVNNNIDPESATPISSEQLSEDQQPELPDGGQSSNATVRNFAISRSQIERLEGQGELERLTIAVTINHDKAYPLDEEGNTDWSATPEYTEFTAEELQEIEEIAKNAVGYNEDRGDQFTIQQILFDTNNIERMAHELQDEEFKEDIAVYVRYGLMILGVLLALFLVRSAVQKMSVEEVEEQEDLPVEQKEELTLAPPGNDDDEILMLSDAYLSKLSPEARAKLKAKQVMFTEIKQQAETNPEDAAHVIRSWLADDQRAAFEEAS